MHSKSINNYNLFKSSLKMMIIIVINAFNEFNYSNVIKFNSNPDVQQLSFRL